MDKLTLHDLIEESVLKFGKNEFVAYAGKNTITYFQFYIEMKKIITFLKEYNLEKGDRVAIIGDNSPNWIKIYAAVVYSGLTIVPILPDFPQSDIHHIIRNSGAKIVFVAKNYLYKLEDFEHKQVQDIIQIENFTSIHNSEKKLDFSIYETDHLIFGTVEENDLAAIIYTSGTTGHSKGVMLTHKNLTSDVINSLKLFPVTQNDIFLSILPIAHTFECTASFLVGIAVGLKLFFLKGTPSPKTLLSALSLVRPTAFMSVPLIFEKIYRKQVLAKFNSNPLTARLYKIPFFRKKLNKIAGNKLKQLFGGRLRFVMFGGAALSKDVEQFLQDANFPYSTGYGLTETSPILTINPINNVKLGSCGKPIMEVEIKIDNPDAEGVGEILAKGPNIMKGYYNNPEETAKAFTKDGWFKTGDLGYIDEEGYLFIKGRSKNVIIGPNGKNIYPEIIEQKLCQFPYIQQAIVYDENNKLIAKVYPDYDAIDEYLKKSKNEQNPQKIIQKLLESIKKEINQDLPSFSQITKLIEHPEPFSITPTKKVKRYLYINKSNT